jgi:hypothetical protein
MGVQLPPNPACSSATCPPAWTQMACTTHSRSSEKSRTSTSPATTTRGPRAASGSWSSSIFAMRRTPSTRWTGGSWTARRWRSPSRRATGGPPARCGRRTSRRGATGPQGGGGTSRRTGGTARAANVGRRTVRAHGPDRASAHNRRSGPGGGPVIRVIEPGVRTATVAGVRRPAPPGGIRGPVIGAPLCAENQEGAALIGPLKKKYLTSRTITSPGHPKGVDEMAPFPTHPCPKRLSPWKDRGHAHRRVHPLNRSNLFLSFHLQGDPSAASIAHSLLQHGTFALHEMVVFTKPLRGNPNPRANTTAEFLTATIPSF